jgi:hypothetical protein
MIQKMCNAVDASQRRQAEMESSLKFGNGQDAIEIERTYASRLDAIAEAERMFTDERSKHRRAFHLGCE